MLVASAASRSGGGGARWSGPTKTNGRPAMQAVPPGIAVEAVRDGEPRRKRGAVHVQHDAPRIARSLRAQVAQEQLKSRVRTGNPVVLFPGVEFFRSVFQHAELPSR